jgi:hypothetical protein
MKGLQTSEEVGENRKKYHSGRGAKKTRRKKESWNKTK